MDRETYARAVELFERCLGLPEAERAAVLGRACEGDDELRRTVEGMLASGEDDGLTLDTPARGAIDSAMLEAMSGGRDALPDSIGRYRVIGELGRGGMGVVYEAEQEEPRRRVAIKVLPSLGAGGSGRLGSRLRREAHALGQLNHPGIARIYDAGTASVHGQTTPYIAMELIEGGSLDAHVRESGAGLEERLELLARVADAVQAAHLRGIIHRDLKPGNVLVSPGEAGDCLGQPKVLDFGVARLTDSDLMVTSVKTEASQLIGTLQYMSPEQLGGDSGDVDARSDVYALGVMAYEIVSGRRAFDLGGLALGEALSRLQNGRAAPLHTIDATLPRDVELIVSKAMDRDPSRRYQTAAELAGDIRRCLRSEPILARPASSLYQIRMFSRRNRALVGAAVVAVAALVAGLGLAVAGLVSARSSLDRAEQAEGLAVARAEEAEAINEFMRDLLSESDPWQSGGDVSVREALLRSEGLMGDRFANRPIVEAGLRHTIGEALGGIGLHEEGRAQLERAIEIGRSALGDDHPEVFQARVDLAGLLRRMGEPDAAHRVIEEIIAAHDASEIPVAGWLAMRIEEASIRGARGEGEWEIARYRALLDDASGELAPDDDVVLALKNSLGWSLLRMRRADEAREVFAGLVETHRSGGRTSRVRLIIVRNGLAESLFALGHFDEAERLYRETIEMGSGILGESHPDLFVAVSGLSNVLIETREFDEAVPLAERALEMCSNGLGPDHPFTMVMVNNHAESLAKVGRYEEALEVHLENLGRRRGRLGEDHPDVAQSIASIGSTYVRLDRYAKAEVALRDAVERYSALFGPDSPDVINNTMNLAQAIQRQGRLDEAIPIMERVVEAERRTLPENHRYIALDLEKLARMRFDAGHHEAAARDWAEACAMWVANRGERESFVARCRMFRARALARMGDRSEALAMLESLERMLSEPGEGEEPWLERSLAGVLLSEAEVRIGGGEFDLAATCLARADVLLEGEELDAEALAWIEEMRGAVAAR